MSSTLTPAQQLTGLTLKNGWVVEKHIAKLPDATGGYFSEGYLVRNTKGQPAFLKALDYSRAFKDPQTSRRLQELTTAYNFECDVLARCNAKHLAHVVKAIDFGSVEVPLSPFQKVEYIIFEWAEGGDVRSQALVSRTFDTAWSLRSLHHIATGLHELHGTGIAHQDVKPSNVLVFESNDRKLADLGRASDLNNPAPHDAEIIAGARPYAPPELLYRDPPGDWDHRRFGCDAYHLGSMVTFLFAASGATALLFSHLPDHLLPTNWTGSYLDVLPYIRDAWGRAAVAFDATTPDGFKEELGIAVRQLCDPEPARRGHPLTRSSGGNPFSLERYISLFNMLAARAEFRLQRGEN